MVGSNPLRLNGFKFAEFTSPNPEAMARQFEQVGFVSSHRHPTKNITRYVDRPTRWANATPTMQLDYDEVRSRFIKARLP